MIDELPEGRTGECVFCGAMLVINEAEKSIHHATPACPEFRLMLTSTPGEILADPECSICQRRDVELRPYGHNGAPICLPCVKADPEREREAERRLAAQMASSGEIPVIIPGVGIISIEEAQRRGLGSRLVLVDTNTGQILPRPVKA